MGYSVLGVEAAMKRWWLLGPLGLAGLCLLASTPALASGQVLLGTLFDDDTGLGIEGASITLFSDEGQRFGSVGTNAEGRFVIDVPRLRARKRIRIRYTGRS